MATAKPAAKKRADVMKSAWLGEPGAYTGVEWTFPSSPNLKPLRCMIADLTAAMENACTVHGIGQKCGDAGALGQGSTPEQKHEAVAAMIAQISGPDGAWNATRTGGENLTLFNAFQIWLERNGRKPFADNAAFKIWVEKMATARKHTVAEYRASMEVKFEGLRAIMDEVRLGKIKVVDDDITADLDEIDAIEGEGETETEGETE